jgi:Na+-transporting NADH:ubiquinone oxidoreductase subunit NqrE
VDRTNRLERTVIFLEKFAKALVAIMALQFLVFVVPALLPFRWAKIFEAWLETDYPIPNGLRIFVCIFAVACVIVGFLSMTLQRRLRASNKSDDI